MKIILPPNGYLLAIGQPQRTCELARDYSGRVLSILKHTPTNHSCRVIQAYDDIEDMMTPTPSFSAVIVDFTDEELQDYEWRRRIKWMSQWGVRGGLFCVYGYEEHMPHISYMWEEACIERKVRFGLTGKRSGMKLECFGIGKCTGGFEPDGDLIKESHDEPTWYETLMPVAPAAHFRAAAVDRGEYTEMEMTDIATQDTALMDLAAEGYRVTEIEQPPLELGVGHLGLLIASGQLAGRVNDHVMRGISRKVEHTYMDERNRSVTVEQVEIMVRTIDQRGKIEEYTA